MNQHLRALYLKLEAHQRQAQALLPTRQIAHTRQKVQQLSNSLDQACQTRIRWLHQKLDPTNRLQQLDRTLTQQIQQRRSRLQHVTENLESINPRNLLHKGYTILFSEKGGSAITSIQALRPDQQIRLLLADGQATATVQNTQPTIQSHEYN